MDHQKVLEVIGEKGPLTAEELSEEFEEGVMKVRKELMRLSEENLVESFEEKGKIKWVLKEEDEEEKNMERRAFQ